MEREAVPTVASASIAESVGTGSCVCPNTAPPPMLLRDGGCDEGEPRLRVERHPFGLVLVHSARSPESVTANAARSRSSNSVVGSRPYGRYALSERVSVWGMAGVGEGTLTLTPEGQAPIRPDMALAMGALGIRGVLVDGGTEGPTLAATSDAMAVRTSTEAVTGFAASEADVTRVRLGLEGSQPMRLGGDAETGFGADIGARLILAAPSRGLSAELRARGLLTHEVGGMRERGVSGSATATPAVSILARPVRPAPGTTVVVLGNVIRISPIRVRTAPTPAPTNGTKGPIFASPSSGGSTYPASMPDRDDSCAATDYRSPGSRKFARPSEARRGRYSTSTSIRMAGAAP